MDADTAKWKQLASDRLKQIVALREQIEKIQAQQPEPAFSLIDSPKRLTLYQGRITPSAHGEFVAWESFATLRRLFEMRAQEDESKARESRNTQEDLPNEK